MTPTPAPGQNDASLNDSTVWGVETDRPLERARQHRARLMAALDEIARGTLRPAHLVAQEALEAVREGRDAPAREALDWRSIASDAIDAFVDAIREHRPGPAMGHPVTVENLTRPSSGVASLCKRRAIARLTARPDRVGGAPCGESDALVTRAYETFCDEYRRLWVQGGDAEDHERTQRDAMEAVVALLAPLAPEGGCEAALRHLADQLGYSLVAPEEMARVREMIGDTPIADASLDGIVAAVVAGQPPAPEAREGDDDGDR